MKIKYYIGMLVALIAMALLASTASAASINMVDNRNEPQKMFSGPGVSALATNHPSVGPPFQPQVVKSKELNIDYTALKVGRRINSRDRNNSPPGVPEPTGMASAIVAGVIGIGLARRRTCTG